MREVINISSRGKQIPEFYQTLAIHHKADLTMGEEGEAHKVLIHNSEVLMCELRAC